MLRQYTYKDEYEFENVMFDAPAHLVREVRRSREILSRDWSSVAYGSLHQHHSNQLTVYIGRYTLPEFRRSKEAGRPRCQFRHAASVSQFWEDQTVDHITFGRAKSPLKINLRLNWTEAAYYYLEGQVRNCTCGPSSAIPQLPCR